MSIFLKCCRKKESKDSNDHSDESYDKVKTNVKSEGKEEENQELVEEVLVPQKSDTVDSFIKVSQFKKPGQRLDDNIIYNFDESSDKPNSEREEEIQEVVEEVLVAKKTAKVDSFIRVAQFERGGQQLDDHGNYKDVW